MAAGVLVSAPAAAAPPTAPTVSIQPVWTLAAPEPSAGAVVWARTPGLFTTPDGTRIFSALSRRSFTGRITCDDVVPGERSVVQAIDTRTGTIASTVTPDLPVGAPISRFAMDDGAQRMLVLSAICPTYIGVVLDPSSGAQVARWEKPATHLPLQLTMGVDPSVAYLVDWTDGPTAGSPEFLVQAMDILTGAIRWTSSIGIGPWADFGADTDRQYQSQRLAVSADGRQVYVIPSTRSEMTVLDSAGGQVVGRVPLPASSDLRSIVVSPVSPRAFVTDWTNNAIRVVDTETLALSSSLSVPGRCLESTDIDATGDLLGVLAACDDPRTILLRTADGTVAAESPAPAGGSELRLLPDASGLVTRRLAELRGSSISESLPATRPNRKAAPVPAPTQPRALTIAPTTTAAKITWRPPANAARAKVSGYRVVSRPGGKGCVVKAAARSCTLTGLEPGRRYAFTVEARNASGWGLRTQSPVITLPVPTPPAAAPAPAPTPPPKPVQPIS
jgi:hypothetical protein